MSSETDLLEHLYDRFNARDMDSVLSGLHPDVIWANGLEGGYVYGRDGVRDYWTRQWATMDPRVEPTSFSMGEEGTVSVEVHQTVRDLEGHVLSDTRRGHIFQLENGLIRRFDIR